MSLSGWITFSVPMSVRVSIRTTNHPTAYCFCSTVRLFPLRFILFPRLNMYTCVVAVGWHYALNTLPDTTYQKSFLDHSRVIFDHCLFRLFSKYLLHSDFDSVSFATNTWKWKSAFFFNSLFCGT